MATQGGGCRDKNSLGLQTNGLFFFFANYSDRTLYCLIGTMNQTCTDAFRTKHSSQKPGPRCCPTQLPHTTAPHKFPPHSCPGQLPPHKLPPHTTVLHRNSIQGEPNPQPILVKPHYFHKHTASLEHWNRLLHRETIFIYIFIYFFPLSMYSHEMGKGPFVSGSFV